MFEDTSFLLYDTTIITFRPDKKQSTLAFNYTQLPEATYSHYPFKTNMPITKTEQNVLFNSPDFYKTTLPDVVVTAYKKQFTNPIDSIEDKYESMEFKNAQALKNVYVANDPTLNTYGANFNTFILARLGITLIPPYPTFFVNEQMMPMDAAAQTQINDIVFLKYYKYLVDAPGGGGSKGVIAFYTKRGFESEKSTTGFTADEITGYTISKEFYSPDYSKINNEDAIADHRKTLYWNPQVDLNNTDKKHIAISFYNNDIAKKFRIIIEGIKADGTPVHLEKVVE